MAKPMSAAKRLTVKEGLLRCSLACLVAGILCSLMTVVDPLSPHRVAKGTEREAIGGKPSCIYRLLSDNDGDEVKLFIDAPVDLLGVIAPIKDDIRTGKGWVSFSQLL